MKVIDIVCAKCKPKIKEAWKKEKRIYRVKIKEVDNKKEIIKINYGKRKNIR